MKKRIIQILLALSLIFLQINLVLGNFQSSRKVLSTSKSWVFSDSTFAGKWCSFVSSHLSTSFCRKEDFSFQVAVEVLYLPFTGLHHFVYVGLPLVLFHNLVFKSNFFEWNGRNDGETGVPLFLAHRLLHRPYCWGIDLSRCAYDNLFQKLALVRRCLAFCYYFRLYSYQFCFNSSWFFHLC